jgi:hypothetical protein
VSDTDERARACAKNWLGHEVLLGKTLIDLAEVAPELAAFGRSEGRACLEEVLRIVSNNGPVEPDGDRCTEKITAAIRAKFAEELR